MTQSDEPLVGEVHAGKAIIARTIQHLHLIKPSKPLPAPFWVHPDIATFTGRETQVTDVERALTRKGSMPALCALSGMGGVGKTAIAIHAAHRLSRAGRFRHGILWADLGSKDVSEVTASFIRAFGYTDDQIPDGSAERLTLYRSILRDKDVLVVLDNAQSDQQALQLLPNSPTAAVIVTSRSKMWGLTDHGALILDLDVFSRKESVALLRRYGEARVDEEPDAAREICRLVGDLPLAVAIAGARLSDASQWGSLSSLATRLRNEHLRLKELRTGDRVARDLCAVLSLSYDALSSEAKRAFVHLSLFGRADITSSGLVAALQITKQEGIDRLEQLVTLSLVLRSGQGSYRLHDLVRLFAAERLEKDTPEWSISEARRRLDRVLSLQLTAARLGAQASLHARKGEWDQAIALYKRTQTIDEQLEDRAGLASSHGGLAAAYAQRGDWKEAIHHYELAQKWNEETHNLWGQASALGGLASIFKQRGDWVRAISYYCRAQKLNEQVGNLWGQARALGGLGSVYAKRGDARKGDLDQAIGCYKRSLHFNKEVGSLWGQASALGGLGSAYSKKRQWRKAIECYLKALGIQEKLGDHPRQGQTLAGLGSAHSRLGEPKPAISYYLRALRIQENLGDRPRIAQTLGGLGSASAGLRNWPSAVRYFKRASEIQEALKDHHHLGMSLCGLARALSELNRTAEALRCAERARTVSRGRQRARAEHLVADLRRRTRQVR